MPSQSPLINRLDSWLSTFHPADEEIAARKKRGQLRDEFIARFPLASLPALTLSQYAIGTGKNDSLCWWVERGTKPVCSYFPGSSRSYGMYFAKEDGSVRETVKIKAFRDSTPGTSDDDVLQGAVLKPLHEWLSKKGEVPSVPTVGEGFALKLLVLYYPDEFIHITSTAWMDKILSALGMANAGSPAANSRAIRAVFDGKRKEFPSADFSQQDFVGFFVNELGLKEKGEKEPDRDDDKQTATPMKHPLNTILYGPPGTGKTHDVVNHVLNIVDGTPIPSMQTAAEYAAARARYDELVQQRRVAFATFHQSYGYEDFIEGIRPVLDEDGTDESHLLYKLQDGAFKAFCETAKTAGVSPDGGFGVRPGATVWKVSLEGTGDNPTRADCMKRGAIRIGWDEYGPEITAETFAQNASGKAILNAFLNEMQVGDLVVSCWSATETDAIGVVTGDPEWHPEFPRYKRSRSVKWLVKGVREDIRPVNGGRAMTLGTVYRLRADVSAILGIVRKHLGVAAHPVSELPFVFVIDEINRGNVSKVFGELITLVEPSKRLGAEEETTAKLPVSGSAFGVPRNVYLLGTMNTADRSIALLDTALRRRFDFVEMMPRPGLLRDIHVADAPGLDLEKLLSAINDRVEFLLDREHTIGHAYFLGEDFRSHPTLAGLAAIFRNRVVPLLQEYFFDDYAKIRLVLGDATIKAKRPDWQFVTEVTKKDGKDLAEALFPGLSGDLGPAINPDQPVYRINAEAFRKAESYLHIYAPLTAAQAAAPDPAAIPAVDGNAGA